MTFTTEHARQSQNLTRWSVVKARLILEASQSPKLLYESKTGPSSNLALSFPCYRTSLQPGLLLGLPAGVWEGTLARFRSGLHPAHVGPPRWQAVVGPVLAGLGILLLVSLALSV